MENKEIPDFPDKNTILNEADAGETINEGVDDAPEVELSDIEKDASAMGWTPKEDWVASGKDPKAWRDAATWIDRGQFFSTINSLRGELAATKQQVGQAYELGRKMAEASLKEEIASLKADKREALAVGDLVKADEIQEIIDVKKEQTVVPPKVPRDFTPPQEYTLFVQRNPWYETNRVLRHTADAVGQEYFKANPQATPAELYYFVEETMRKEFGDKQAAPATHRRGPATETGGQTRNASPATGGNLSTLKRNMSSQEREIMKNIISVSGMKEEEYLKEYAKIKDR